MIGFSLAKNLKFKENRVSMKILKLLFLNRNVILILGVVAGLVWGKGAVWTESLILPVLALVMTIATMGIDGSSFRSAKEAFSFVFFGIVMSYLVLSGVIVLLVAMVLWGRRECR